MNISEYAYNFYGFYLKNYGFSGSRENLSQTNYDNTLVKLNVINKTIIFSLYMTPPEIGNS